MKRSTNRAAPRRSLLGRFLIVSLLVHLVLMVSGLLHAPPISVQPAPTEVELVSQEESQGAAPAAREEGPPQAAQQPTPRASQPPRSTRPAARASRQPRPSQPVPGIQDPCLLGMRDCSAAGEAAPERPAPRAASSPASRDRLASFQPRPGEARADGSGPVVQNRIQHEGLELASYEDGGRLLRSTGGKSKAPGVGAAGLLTLASSRLGDSIGRLACDPYRGSPADGPRHLVLLVDTSGSIVSSRRVPAVIVCAAGAALAALSRGYPVTVANFSKETIFYRTSHSSDVIYTAISRIQGETTILPRLSLLPLGRGDFRDYVLVSDAAIHNLKQVLPDYQRTFRREPHSRGLLFALGEDQAQGREVAALERAGFHSDRVEGPGRDFQRFLSRSLESLLPPVRALRQARRLQPRLPAM